MEEFQQLLEFFTETLFCSGWHIHIKLNDLKISELEKMIDSQNTKYALLEEENSQLKDNIRIQNYKLFYLYFVLKHMSNMRELDWQHKNIKVIIFWNPYSLWMMKIIVKQ